MKKILLSVVLCMAAYFTAQAQSQLEQGKRLYQEAWNYCYNIIPQQWQTDHASKLYRQALPYLQTAAKEGYGEACYLLGNMYSKELGVKKDYAIAKRMYELSIEYGHNRGKVGLGDVYLDGESNSKKAFELYSQAYQTQEPEAACRIAMFYYYKDLAEAIGEKTDNQKGFALIEPHLSEAGNSSNKYVLYMTAAYHSSQHEKYKAGDAKRAQKEASMACELLYKAGFLYETVKWMYYYDQPSVRCTYLKYRDFLIYSVISKALQCNYTELQKGEMLYIYALYASKYNDMNYKSNYGYTIMEAMEQAAVYGFPPAQKTLGDWYANGTHTAKNPVKAREWYKKASSNGEKIPQI